MNIIIGKNSGFCMGVKNTYDIAKEIVKKQKTYCLGEIIHNKEVVQELEKLGMITVDKIENIKDNNSVIFRAHGEPPSSYEYAKIHNLKIFDLTCGKVKLIHNKVLKKKTNSFIIIIGKKNHPEIIGTKGFAGINSYIIENKNDIDESYQEFLKSNKNNVYIVSQTTFSNEEFLKLSELIKKKYQNIEINLDKTICRTTETRQLETKEISQNSDLMIVIGDKNSSNTKELYNIALSNCQDTYFIENIKNLSRIKFTKNATIGVVAGASVPQSLIDKVIITLKKKEA